MVEKAPIPMVEIKKDIELREKVILCPLSIFK